MKLDPTDLHILRVLQQEGSLHNFELAKRVHLSPSPCSRRVRKLEEYGVIDRYVAVINHEKIEKSVVLFARVWLTSQSADALESFTNYIKPLNEVLESHIMASECHFLLKIIVPDLDAFGAFQNTHLNYSNGVRSVKIEVPLKTIKNTSAIPI